MKFGYNINRIGNNINITSTIYCIDRIRGVNNPPTVTPTAVTAFITYIRNNINQIWSSATNRGLQPPFNNSGQTVTCNVNTSRIYTPNLFNLLSITNQQALDTLIQSGQNIQPAFNIQGIPAGTFIVNLLPGPGRSNIQGGGGNNRFRVGNFFYNPTHYNATTNTYHPHNSTMDAEDNTPAHEFGHVMGLADRYAALANARNLQNPNFRRFAKNRASDPPMYLPGFYNGPAGNNDGPFTALPSDTAYLQGLNAVNPINPGSSGTPLSLVSPQPAGLIPNNVIPPQNHYDAMPYDIEYSSRFGWEHNLMSRPVSPNETRDISEFRTINDATYNLIYDTVTGALAATSLPTVIITTRQLNIILNTIQAEDEIAPANITSRFAFVRNATGTINEQRNTLQRGGNDPLVYSNNRSNFLSFVGLKLSGNDFDNGSIVSDTHFNNNNALTTFSYYGIGINDVMDYRMSIINTGSPSIQDQWSLPQAQSSPFNLYGCYNPNFNNPTGQQGNFFNQNLLNQLGITYTDAIELGGINVVTAITTPAGLNVIDQYSAINNSFGYFSTPQLRALWDTNIFLNRANFRTPLRHTDALWRNYNLDAVTAVNPPPLRAITQGGTYGGGDLTMGAAVIRNITNHPFRTLMVDVLIGS